MTTLSANNDHPKGQWADCLEICDWYQVQPGKQKKNNYYKNVYETLRVIEVVFYIKYDEQENLHQV